MKNVIPPKTIRQVFVLLLIVIFASLIFTELLPYLSGVLGAVTIYVLLRKPMVFLVKKKWKPNFAALFLMLISFVCILLPVTGIVIMLGNKIGEAVDNSKQVATALKGHMIDFENKFGYDLSSRINVEEISSTFILELKSYPNLFSKSIMCPFKAVATCLELSTASPILLPNIITIPVTGNKIQTKEISIKNKAAKLGFHFFFTKKTMGFLNKT